MVPTLTDAEYSELMREAVYYQLLVCGFNLSFVLLGLFPFLFSILWSFGSCLFIEGWCVKHMPLVDVVLHFWLAGPGLWCIGIEIGSVVCMF